LPALPSNWRYQITPKHQDLFLIILYLIFIFTIQRLLLAYPPDLPELTTTTGSVLFILQRNENYPAPRNRRWPIFDQLLLSERKGFWPEARMRGWKVWLAELN